MWGLNTSWFTPSLQGFLPAGRFLHESRFFLIPFSLIPSRHDLAFLQNPTRYKLEWRFDFAVSHMMGFLFAQSQVLKVFRYSFFGTIPHFLNRLLDSLPLVWSTWNLHYLLFLDWTLAWFTFFENRYFHDNDKQKSSKTVKLKFCAIQISLWKANTNILNCGVCQTKYTRTKKICMFVLK